MFINRMLAFEWIEVATAQARVGPCEVYDGQVAYYSPKISVFLVSTIPPMVHTHIAFTDH